MAALIGDTEGVLVQCATCGQTNRLRYASLDKESRCGKCKSALEPARTPVAVNDVPAFDRMLAASVLPIVVDFWAQWCGPCRAMAPEFEKVAQATAGKWLVAKVDTDKVPELGERYRIMSIPTLAVFRQGKERARKSGAMPAQDIQQFINSAP
jgi:thioredoxin 2